MSNEHTTSEPALAPNSLLKSPPLKGGEGQGEGVYKLLIPLALTPALSRRERE
jgi:hypothetical protein